jgi:hypothetical protein
MMEVFAITVLFFSVVACAMAFGAFLLGRAVERDRQYLLAAGELPVRAARASLAEEAPILADGTFHLLPEGLASQVGTLVGPGGERAHLLTAAGFGVLVFVVLWRALLPQRAS